MIMGRLGTDLDADILEIYADGIVSVLLLSYIVTQDQRGKALSLFS